MSALNPKGLLKQAKHLAQLGKPQQVNLRRAVSAAYYATFHLLVSEASRALSKGRDRRLAMLLARSFGHEDMAAACRTFASGGSPPAIIQQSYPHLIGRDNQGRPTHLTLPPELVSVAQAFVDLQKARHDADYATHRRWTRTEALAEVARADGAFSEWDKIRSTSKRPAGTPVPSAAAAEAVRLFLGWLAFQKKLQGR